MGTAAATLALPGTAKAQAAAGSGAADTYAALRALNPALAAVLVGGALALGDGGGGGFIYDAADTTSPDDGGTLIVAANGARYRRVYGGALHVAWFGGFTEAAVLACLLAALAAGKSVCADAGLYDMGSTGLAFAQPLGNLTFTADPMAIFQSSGDGSSPVFSFTQVGANLTWTGGQYGYGTAPATRAADVLDFWGDAITNIRLANLRIFNGANFGVWVRGMAAAGSAGLVARDIQISGTLGDGFHVENFDSDVSIDGIIGVNNGDDVCAVVNYQPLHPNPTTNVVVNNVIGASPTFAVLKLLGVDGFSADNIVGRNGTGANACVLNLGVGGAYGAVLRNGAFGKVVGENITNIVFPGVAGKVELGNLSFESIVGTGVTGNGIQIVGGPSTNIHNITFGSIVLGGAAAAGSAAYPAENFGLWIAYANRIAFGAIQVSGFYQNLNVTNCADINFGGMINSIDAYPSTQANGGGSFGVQIQYNTDLVLNDISYRRVNSPATQAGIIVNHNSTVDTRGPFTSPPAASGGAAFPFVFGNNTGVTGAIQRGIFTIAPRAVTAGAAFVTGYPGLGEAGAVFTCAGAVQTSGPPQPFTVINVTGAEVTVQPSQSSPDFALSGEVVAVLK